MSIKDLGSVLLSSAFIINLVFFEPKTLLIDFAPSIVIRDFIFPIPTKYKLAPALVFKYPFSRSRMTDVVSLVNRAICSANSGSETLTCAIILLVKIAQNNNKIIFFIIV